jgi:molybdopterin-biosynthesis enzyme MoeA-like protein
VPTIFEAMLAGLLPTLTGGPPVLSQSLRIARGEGDIAEALGALAQAHPEVSIGSYPFQRDGVHGSNVGVRSQDGTAVDRVMADLSRMFPDAR